MTCYPRSQAGKWAVALAALAVGGTVGLAIAFSLGLEPADNFTDDGGLLVIGVVVLASGVSSLVAGADALIRCHDRSWLMISVTALGGLATALILQQVAEGLGWLKS